jgi:long-chain fatty acid transport protein
MTGTKWLTALASTSALVALAPSAVSAGGFALRDHSAYGEGVAFAGIAAGGSLSSMYWNPATMTAVERFELEAVGAGIFPDVEIDPVAPTPTLPLGDSGPLGQDAFVPAGFAAYRVGEQLVLGVSVSAPYGLVTAPDVPWAGQTYSLTSKAMSLNVAPTVAFEVTDWLSIGAGVEAQYFDARVRAAILPVAGSPIGELTGDDVGFGFTLGMKVEPVAGTEIGLGFRSMVSHELEGSFFVPGLVPETGITADLDLPEVVSLGIRQRITDSFRVLGGVEWTNWSRLSGDVAVIDEATGLPLDLNLGQPGAQGLPFFYDDGWFFSLGGEVDVNERLTLRSGVGWEVSPVDDDSRNTQVPDDDRLWLSAGGSFQATRNVAFDLGYTFLTTFGTEIAIDPTNPQFNGLPFFADVDSTAHIVAAAVKVKLGAPPAAAAVNKL